MVNKESAAVMVALFFFRKAWRLLALIFKHSFNKSSIMKKLLSIVAVLFAATSFPACSSDTSTSNASDSTVVMTPPTLDAPAASNDTAMAATTATENGAKDDKIAASHAADESTPPETANRATGASSSTKTTIRNNPETDRNPLTNNPRAKANIAPKTIHGAHDSIDSRFGLAPSK